MKRNNKKTALFHFFFIMFFAGGFTPNIYGTEQHKLIAFTSERDGNGNIYIMETDGGNLQRLTDDPGYDAWPTWKPDGSRIAFVSTRSGNPDFYVMNLDGTNVQQLTDNSADDLWPEWSPDGTRIVFTSNREGNFNIYVMDSNGGNLQRLTSLSASEDFPAWSPDSYRIVFSRIGGSDGTYIMNADGSDEQKLLDFPALESDWSPDGAKIAFGSDHEGFRAIYVVNSDGSNLQRLSTTYYGDNCPDWSSDGSKILFASWRNGNSEIYVMNADGSSQQRLTVNSSQDEFSSWQPLSMFTRVTEGPQVSDGGFSFGASWIDYDNDGFPDLMVSNSRFFGSPSQSNVLYHNNGDGSYSRFINATIDSDTNSMTSVWGDFDGDSDLDAYLVCVEQLNHFYVNEGHSGFVDYEFGPFGDLDEWTSDAVWVDYNNDGSLDLFLANHRNPINPPGPTGALYRNDNGVLTHLSNTAIGLIEDEASSAAWGDYDNDGDCDLFWTRNENNSLLFENNGDGTFTQVFAGDVILDTTHAGHWADYDNDGDLDLCANSGWGRPLTLYENISGILLRVAPQQLTTDTGYWEGGYWGDYDNDGYLDLFVAGNYLYNDYLNRLYHNDGDGTFSRVTTGIIATDTEPSACAVWADHDRDGDLDLYVVNASNTNNTLYENNGNDNNWININLVGSLSNHNGIGAKVRLKATVEVVDMWQMREISSRAGLRAQTSHNAHFGLGDASVIDTILVEWPSGVVDTLTGVPVNQFMTIREGDYIDLDEDGIVGFDDNCPEVYNPGQEDNNDDGIGNACCCTNTVGNVDCSELEEPDISDITRLIDYLYLSHEILCCPCEADADGSGDPEPDISDITRIIDYLYISHNPLVLCP